MSTITQITGGLVSVEDGTNPTPDVFGTSRKVRVEISFSVQDGAADQDAEASAILDSAARKAALKVDYLLKRTPQAETAEPRSTGVVAEQLAASVEATKPASRKRPPKVEEPESPPADEGYTSAPDAHASAPEAPAAEAKAESAPGGEDEWGAAAAEEIADKALTDAASKHSARLTDAGDANAVVRIRKLIGTYNPDPTKQFSLTQLPQSQRADFLAKIAGLKPGEDA